MNYWKRHQTAFRYMFSKTICSRLLALRRYQYSARTLIPVCLVALIITVFTHNATSRLNIMKHTSIHSDLGLTKIWNCVDDLQSQYPSGYLPEIKNPSVSIPFFVIPDPLPQDVRWSDCYLTKSETHNKKIWGYYFAKQLENHPWRVYDPNDAMIFILPWFENAPEKAEAEPIFDECKPLFLGVGKTLEAMELAFDDYPQMKSHNTLFMLGSYMRRMRFRQRFNDQTVKYGDTPDYLKVITATFTPAIARYVDHPYQLVMPVNVDNGLCFPSESEQSYIFSDPRDRLDFCGKLTRKIESDFKLSHDDWLISRPISTQSIGKFDGRKDYLHRLVASYALNEKGRQNKLPAGLQPSYLMYNHQKKSQESGHLAPISTGGIVESCRNELDVLLEKKDPRLVDGIYCAGGIDRAWRDNISSYNTVNWDIKKYSRSVISMRGDSLGSQRSFEGMFFGSLTFHDEPLELLGLSVLPLGNLVPWRLTGYFDEAKCVKNRVERYALDYMKYMKIDNGEKSFMLEKTPNMSESDQNELIEASEAAEDDIVKCFNRLPLLIDENPDMITLMRRVIGTYRDDVLWETPNSRLAENILYQAASQFDAHYLDSFGLSSYDFRPRFPSSCTADTQHILNEMRNKTSKGKSSHYLSTLSSDVNDIFGAWGTGPGL